MLIIEFTESKLNYAIAVLDDFIASYGRMEDAERLEKSNTIFDSVRTYLRVEENLLMPPIRRQKELYADLLDEAHLVHERIKYILEHSIMMHVDEPQHEYYNRMVQLREHLLKSREVDQNRLFPWLRQYLGKDEELRIATQLENQMTEESIPSSGMTIY